MEKYRYNSPEARYAKVNRVFVLGGALLLGVMLLYVCLYRKEVVMTQSTFIGNCVMLVLFGVINMIVYGRNKATKALRVLIAVEVCVEFVFYSLTTTAAFMGMALIGVLGISLAYYDKKYFSGLFVVCTVLYVACQVIRGTMGLMVFDANGLCLTIITCAIFIMLMRIGSITKAFSDDSLSAIEEQKQTQEKMLEEILEISQIVKNESDRSRELVRLLVEAAQQTAVNSREISQTTDTIAGNLEVQTRMTRNIQEAIAETETRSHEMVTIAADSNDQILENGEMMDELKAHSAEIARTNDLVTEAMERLQRKTQEVESFTSAILNISSQTNLLAINASIESARAGAAGKGFAVVARQIRQLAEETRQSVERITTILKDLMENEKEVVETVHISVEATKKQREMILLTADMFDRLGKNMTQLVSNIGVINGKIEKLSASNHEMVDSVSQIAGSTQEVSANAEETKALTAKNLTYAQRTSTAINSIQKTTARLEQYL